MLHAFYNLKNLCAILPIDSGSFMYTLPDASPQKDQFPLAIRKPMFLYASTSAA